MRKTIHFFVLLASSSLVLLQGISSEHTFCSTVQYILPETQNHTACLTNVDASKAWNVQYHSGEICSSKRKGPILEPYSNDAIPMTQNKIAARRFTRSRRVHQRTSFRKSTDIRSMTSKIEMSPTRRKVEKLTRISTQRSMVIRTDTRRTVRFEIRYIGARKVRRTTRNGRIRSTRRILDEKRNDIRRRIAVSDRYSTRSDLQIKRTREHRRFKIKEKKREHVQNSSTNRGKIFRQPLSNMRFNNARRGKKNQQERYQRLNTINFQSVKRTKVYKQRRVSRLLLKRRQSSQLKRGQNRMHRMKKGSNEIQTRSRTSRENAFRRRLSLNDRQHRRRETGRYSQSRRLQINPYKQLNQDDKVRFKRYSNSRERLARSSGRYFQSSTKRFVEPSDIFINRTIKFSEKPAPDDEFSAFIPSKV